MLRGQSLEMRMKCCHNWPSIILKKSFPRISCKSWLRVRNFKTWWPRKPYWCLKYKLALIVSKCFYMSTKFYLCCWAYFFWMMRSCIFQNSFFILFAHLHQTLSAFKTSKSRSSTTSYTPCTNNELSNFNEYVVAIEKE